MIRERLWNGDVLRILWAEDLGFDVWVEKYGNPPQVFFEGKALPIDRFEQVLEAIDRYVGEDGVRLSWNGHIPSKRG